MKYLIRPSTPIDNSQISKLLDLAFEGNAESKLVTELSLSSAYVSELSLVLEVEGNVMGYILFTQVMIEPNKRDINLLALAPIAVLPGYQSRGLGSALVRHGLKKARQLNFDGVLVLGHKDYYPRFGFRPASDWQIICPWPVPDSVFMALELKEYALADVSGLIKYPQPFLDL